MADPCLQEGKIGHLNATVNGIEKALERLAEGQDRFIEVLERIAAQGTEIETLKAGQGLLFERVRQVELDASAARVKVGGIVAGVSIAVTVVTTFIAKHLGIGK